MSTLKIWTYTILSLIALGLIGSIGCGGGETFSQPSCAVDPSRSFAVVAAMPAATSNGMDVAYCAELDQPVTDCSVSVQGREFWCAVQACPGTWTVTACGWSDEHGRPAATCVRDSGSKTDGCVSAGYACVANCQ